MNHQIYRSWELGLVMCCVLAWASAGCSGGDDGAGSGTAGSGTAGGGTAGGGTAGSASTSGGSSAQAGSSSAGNPTSEPAGGATDAGPDPNAGACDYVVYDGEAGSHPSSTDGLVYVGWPMETNHAQDTNDAKFGAVALQNVLDPNGTCCGTFYYSWSNWDMDQTKVLDVSAFDTLEFWIKIESGLYWNLQVELQDVNQTSSFTGNDIHIADYIEGKNIDMTWRQAAVPIKLFDTNGIDLKHVSSFIIEGDRAVTFDLDDVKFTKSNCK